MERQGSTSTGEIVNGASKIVVIIASSIFAFIALLAGLFVADQWKLAQEYDEWLTVSESIEDEMERHLAVIRLERGKYDAEALTNEQKIAYWQVLGASAYRTSVAIAPLAGDMEDLAVLPWHGGLNEARNDYLDHVDAWQSWYDELYDFGKRIAFLEDWTAPQSGTEISTTFAAAGRSAKKALPTLFLGDLRTRVEMEFAN